MHTLEATVFYLHDYLTVSKGDISRERCPKRNWPTRETWTLF